MSEEEIQNFIKEESRNAHSRPTGWTLALNISSLIMMVMMVLGGVGACLAYGRDYAILPHELKLQAEAERIAIQQQKEATDKVEAHISKVEGKVNDHDSLIRDVESKQAQTLQLASDTHENVEHIRRLLDEGTRSPVLK